jgi:ABC-type phosphate/phosphonate transport system substrate-binding protein
MDVPKGAAAALPALSGRLAFNERGSLSGWIALAEDAGDPGGWASALLETGSHRESIRAVAEGRADLAAVDCRSWALALQHEPCAQALVVVGWSAARPGLPYVTSRNTDPALTADLRAALIALGAHAPLTEEETE